MKNKKKIILLTIIFGVILILTASLTFAKYVYNSAWNYYLHSKEFYFSVENLDINNKKNSILTWDGSDITFNIKNSENDSLVSDYDISYKVSCEILNEEKEYLNCNLNNTGEPIYFGKLSSSSKCIDEKEETDVSNLIKSKCELSGYTWKNEITNKEIGFNIELKDETKSIDEVSVQIKVESTYPYKRVLKGIFNLNLKEPEEEFIVYYQEFEQYNEITITNKIDQDACFNLSFDTEKNLYDNSSSDVVETFSNNSEVINKLKIKINKQMSSKFNFYKINSEDTYSIEDFTLEKIDC